MNFICNFDLYKKKLKKKTKKSSKFKIYQIVLEAKRERKISKNNQV